MKLTLLDLSEAKKIQAATAYKGLNLANPAGWTDVFTGMKTASGQIVSREKAMRCGAVLACTRILMEDIASLPHILKRKSANGASDALDDPRYRLLKSAPNPLQTAFEVREHQILDLLLDGKFFCYIPRDGRGRIQGIYPLAASAVTYGGIDANGELVWNSGDINFPHKSRFSQSELWRGTLLNHNFVDGRSLTLLAREAIGLAIAAEQQGARLFSHGVQSDLTLSTPEDLGPNEKKELREAFMERHAGSHNAFLPLILSGGMEAKRIGLTAQESQYVESRSYQLADIARIFRVPGVLLGLDNKTSTYASAEQFFLAYVRNTIMPWVVRLEQTADRDLILPSETNLFTKHKLSSLLRADQKTRYDSYRSAIEGGFMQPAQAREEEEWDEIDGLNVNWRPANFVVVGQEATTTPNQAQNTPKTPDKPAQSARLAASISASILRSETREFARMSQMKSVSEAKSGNWMAWHVEKVMELTGATGPTAREYSEWRFANPDAEDEARTRLTNLCLEGI